MAGFSNYLENALLDHVLGNTAYSAPATTYISLHTSDPGDTGANEVSGNSYARVSATNNTTNWPNASSGSKSNGTTFTFPAATGAGWGTVSHFGIWDASSAGNNLFSGSLSASQSVPAGVTASFNSSTMTITLD